MHAEYPDVELEHMYVDNCAMQLVRDPRQFDVILTDLKMEKVDGMTLLSKAKQNHPDTEVIIITGYASVETAVECARMGAVQRACCMKRRFVPKCGGWMKPWRPESPVSKAKMVNVENERGRSIGLVFFWWKF